MSNFYKRTWDNEKNEKQIGDFSTAEKFYDVE